LLLDHSNSRQHPLGQYIAIGTFKQHATSTGTVHYYWTIQTARNIHWGSTLLLDHLNSREHPLGQYIAIGPFKQQATSTGTVHCYWNIQTARNIHAEISISIQLRCATLLNTVIFINIIKMLKYAVIIGPIIVPEISYQKQPNCQKNIAFWMVPRLRPFASLLRPTCRRRRLWSIV
jgi:hypothetical protein